MGDPEELQRALAALLDAGPVEVHENGQWLELPGLGFEERSQGSSTIIHLWSAERTLVRRILRVAEKSAGHVFLGAQRLGRTRPDTLAFRCAGRERPEG